jgi:hypothetical protein
MLQNDCTLKNLKPGLVNRVGNIFFQPKLTVNQPNDKYEQEADSVAEKLLQMEPAALQKNSNSFFKAAPLSITSVQRKCAHCEDEEKQLQRKELNHEETVAGNDIEHYVGGLNSTGQSLPAEVKNFYEPRFGYDLSKVKLHTDNVAAKSARSINALAYTSGNNIVFNSGQYSPATDSGKKLLGHELTHVIQQQNSIAPSLISRKAVSKDFTEADRSVLTVGRNTKAGQCKLLPKTQTKTSGDIGGKTAFIQFDFCRGGSGGSVRGELNYGDAVNKANQAAKDFFNSVGGGQNAKQAFETLKQQLNRIAPDAKVKFGFQAKDVRVNVGGTTDVGGQNGVKGKGTAAVEVDIGPVTIGVEGEVTGGTQDKTDGQVLITIKNADNGPAPADCHVCNCTAPDITYWCNKKPGKQKPPKDPDPVVPLVMPLYFEYAEDIPRKGWEQSFDAMIGNIVSLAGRGYSIEKIEGYTSPEGLLKRSAAGKFENKELSDKRAAAAWNSITSAIKKKLDNRFGTFDFKGLRNALQHVPPVTGLGETFGNAAAGEVANKKLFDHISKLDAAATKEGKDIFTENNIAGKNLPEEVNEENKKLINEFRTGNMEGRRKKLNENERLESLYKTLRRAVVFLKAPVKDLTKIDLKAKPENIVGESVDCTDENKKLLNDAIPLGNELLEGECKEQGKETAVFPK